MSIKLMASRLFIFVAFALALLTTPAHAKTALNVANGTNAPVDVWINSDQPQATHYVATVNGAQVTITCPPALGNNKGVFTLAAGATAVLTTKNGDDAMSGSITFNCIPVCPCGGSGQVGCPVVPGQNLPTKLVNGVSQGEYAVNLANGHEALDISCVNGSNCSIVIKCEGGTPQWTNNITHAPVRQFGNGPVDVAKNRDSNCSTVGVFTYNTTDCVQIVPPVPCLPPQSFCVHTVRDCQLNRKGSGGTVTICVLGIDPQ